jgi:hypothetical protein
MPAYYLPSSLKATSYIWVLSKGYSKCSVRLCGPQRTSVYYLQSMAYYCQCTSSAPHTSSTTDKSICPRTLAYIQFESLIPQNALLADPSVPKFKLTL